MAIDLEQRREAIRADRRAARMSGAGGPTQPMQGDDEKIQVAGALKALRPLLFPSEAGGAFTAARDEIRETGRAAGGGQRTLSPVTPQTAPLLSEEMERTATEAFAPIIERTRGARLAVDGAADPLADAPPQTRMTDEELLEALQAQPDPVNKKQASVTAEQEAEYLDAFNYSKELEENYGIANPLADADTEQILKFIQAPEDVDRAIAIVARMYGDTKTVQEDDVTRRLAASMNVSEKILAGSDTIFDSATTLAARHLLALSGQRLAQLTNVVNDAIKAGQDTPIMHAQLRRQLVLHSVINNKIRGVRAEQGRALRAWSMNIDVDNPIGSMDQIDALLDETGGVKVSRKLAERLANVIDERGEAGLNTFSITGAYAKTVEAVHFAWKAGLLFNPRSQGKNIIGNFLLKMMTLPEQAVAGVVGSAERGIRRATGSAKQAEGVYVGESMARAYAIVDGFRDALRMVGASIKQGATNPSGKVEGINTTANPISGQRGREILGETVGNRLIPENGIISTGIDYLGKGVGASFAGLQSMDEFFRTVLERMQLYEIAYREAARVMNDPAARNTPEAFERATDAGASILANPMSVKDQLIDAADYGTMVDKFGAPGSKSEAFYNAARQIQQTAVGGFVFGFLKTPANVIKRVAERNPMMAALYPKIYQQIGSSDPVVRQKAIGRLVVGSMILASGYQLAASGRLTGANPRDPAKRRMLKALKWEPYALVWPGEDHDPSLPLFDKNGIPTGEHNYLSIAGLEPIGALLSVPAAVHDRLSRTKALDHPDLLQNAMDIGMTAVLESGRYVKELPMLEGMSMINKALEGAFKEKDGSYAPEIAKVLEKFGGTFYGVVPNPVSSLQRTISRQIDPTKRDVTAFGGRWTEEEIINAKDNKVKNNFALFGTEKNSPVGSALESFFNAQRAIALFNAGDEGEQGEQPLPVVYDPAGFPEQEGTGLTNDPFVSFYNMVLPLNLTTAGQSKISPALRESLSEAYRVGANLDHEGWASFKGVDLSPQEKAHWINLSKNVVTLGGLTYRDSLESVFDRPDYQRAVEEGNDYAIRQIYNNIHNDFKAESMGGSWSAAGMPTNPNALFAEKYPATWETILRRARWSASKATGGEGANPTMPPPPAPY
ncbi:hypothetical protein [uncultured Mediterranean phage uvMED]|nr:hypothetical protein [uncultured Mediterranean phage uvMED]